MSKIDQHIQTAKAVLEHLVKSEENEIDKKTSFIYLDPPYIPDSKTADFTDYSKEGFKEDDHERVANVFYQLAEGGYKVVLSNNANKGAKKMYAAANVNAMDEIEITIN